MSAIFYFFQMSNFFPKRSKYNGEIGMCVMLKINQGNSVESESHLFDDRPNEKFSLFINRFREEVVMPFKIGH